MSSQIKRRFFFTIIYIHDFKSLRLCIKLNFVFLHEKLTHDIMRNIPVICLVVEIQHEAFVVTSP